MSRAPHINHQTILELYRAEKHSINAISRMCACSPSTVWRIAERNNVLRHSGTNGAIKQKVLAYYDSDKSIKEISNETGLTLNQIYSVFSRYKRSLRQL